MATRVNTKFVLGLSGVIVAVVLGLVGLYFYKVLGSPEEKIRKAEILLAQGDPRGALDQLGRALHRRQSDVELIDRYLAVVETIPAKDYVEAQRFLGEMRRLKQDAADLRPSEPERLRAAFEFNRELAEKFGGGSWYQALYDYANDKLQNYPDNLLAKRYRGVAGVHLLDPEMPLERIQETRDDLLLVLEKDPSDGGAAHHLALWMLFEAARLRNSGAAAAEIANLRDKAVELSARTLAQDPEDLRRQLDHLEVLLHPDVKRVEEARPIGEAVEARLLSSPEPESAVLAMVDALPRLDPEPVGEGDARAPRGLVRAQAVLEKAVEKRPEEVMYRLMLGRVLTMRGDESGAVAQYVAAQEKGGGKPAVEALRAHELTLSAAMQEMGLRIAQADEMPEGPERDAALKAVEERLASVGSSIQNTGGARLIRGKLALARREFRKATQDLDQAAQQLAGSGSELEARLLSARARRLSGERGAAVEQLERALQLNPGMAGVRLELAELLLAMGQREKAQAQLDAVLAQSPGDAQALSLQARAYAQQGQMDRARETFDRLPDEARARLTPQMAQWLAQSGRGEDAKAMLASHLSSSPADLRAVAAAVALTPDEAERRALLDAAREAGADATALSVLEQQASGGAQTAEERQQLLEDLLDRQEDPFQRALTEVMLYRRLGQPEKAKEALAQAAAIKPEDPQVLELQFNEALAAQDWERAEGLAAKGGQKNVDLANGAFLRARLASAKGDLEQAAAEYRKGLSGLEVFSDGWRELGEVQARLGQIDAAADSFQKAIDQRPDNARAMRGLAAVAEIRGDHPRALELLREAVRYAAGDAGVLNAYLSYEQQHGDAERALKLRQQLAEANPQDRDNRRALAVVQASEGLLPDAVATMEKLIADEGTTPQNVSTLASVYGIGGEPAKGRSVVEEYLRARGGEATAEELVMLARYDLMTGDLDGAIAAYGRAREKEDPQTRAVTRELGDLLFAQGRNEQAVALYAELHAASPEDPVVALRYAESLMRAGQLEEARALTEKHPDSSQAWVLKAVSAMRQEDAAQARAHLEQALRLEPDNAVAMVQLARLLGEDKSQLPRARDLMERLLRDDPSNSEARTTLAVLHERAEAVPDAIREYRNELEQRPQHAAVRVQLIRLHNARGETDAALVLAKQGAELEPEQPVWPRLVAEMESGRQNWSAAVAAAGEAYELSDAPDQLVQYATLLIRAGRAEEALTVLGKRQELVNAEPALQGLRGWALSASGQGEGAEQVFGRAVERAANPGQLDAVAEFMVQAYGVSDAIGRLSGATAADPLWLQLVVAELEMRNRQYAEAARRLATLKAGVPAEGDQGALRQRVQAMLALALYQAGDLGPARDAYEELLAITPDDFGTLNNLAYLLVEDLDLASEGLPHAERAAELAPENPQVLDTLGWAQYKVGRYDEARRTLERAWERQRLAPTAVHLAHVHEKLGDLQQARDYLRQAQRLAEQQNDDVSRQRAQALLDQIGS